MVRSLSIFLALLFCAIASVASAQTGSLQGTVVDPQGRPVPDARVTIASGTAVIATAVTRKDGTFGPIEIPEGPYDVSAAAPSLQAPSRPVIVANVTTMTLTLALSPVTATAVVSAGQVGQPISRVTDSVTIIDKSDLDARQTETASEALRLVPGFNLVSNGGRGAVTSIFARGGESDYALVLMDGLPLTAFGGGFDAAHLATPSIDRIEVVRGPQSAVYGSGAIGGVVNLISQQGGPIRQYVSFEGGQQGTTRLDLATSGSHRAWSWGASFERFASDGDTTVRESIGGPVSNDDYERLIGTGSLTWSDRATRRVRVDARFGRDERGNPGPYGSDPFGLYAGLDTVSRGTNHPRGVIGSAMFGDPRTWRHSMQVGWSDVPSEFVFPDFFTGDPATSTDRTRRVTGRYQADLERGPLGLSVGAEVVRERDDNSVVTGETCDGVGIFGPICDPIPVARTIAGLFAETRWDLGARAAVTAGVRVEYISRDAMEAHPDFFSPRPAFDTDVVWSTNPKVSALWYLRGDRNSDGTHGWTKIRGGAGTGIKPPNVFDIAFTDNPSLKPERSRSVDVGLEHAFPGARVLADVTYFANRYDDLIVTVGSSFSGASRFRSDNIANASARGVEAGLRWESRVGLSVRGAYTFLDTEVLGVDDFPNEAAPPYEVGDPLVRRPKHAGSVDIRYTRDRLLVFFIVNGRGEMTDLEPNFVSSILTNPGYAVSSIGGSFKITRSLEAYARVTNLFDRAYEDAFGYPAQARSASVGVRVAISR
ncbi:MAG TPA: TonB-dependent receptor [Vicinamibacterales bacterium]|nr:TonB-dependent receptor [Vicinamibacterales bacterium]